MRIALAGICGTDLHEYTSGPQYIPAEPHPRSGQQAPLTLGHEMAGTVVKVGEQVTRARPGDRVAIFAILGCGHCRSCRRGVPATCTTMVATGLSTGDGGLSEYVRVKDPQLYPLPNSMSFTQGALVEPAACAVRAVHLGEVQAGNVVLVTGGGPIGQLTAMAAQAAGASSVYISEVVPARRELARRNVPAAVVLDPSTDNVPRAVQDATEGWGADVVFDRTIELMRTGQLPAERIVTAEIPLDDVVELGFDELIRPTTQHAKIHIRPATG